MKQLSVVVFFSVFSAIAHAQTEPSSPPLVRDNALLACVTDAECARDAHCGEHRRLVEKTRTRWVGTCLPGSRADSNDPAPLATSTGPMRFEYAGKSPHGYELHSRPDFRFFLPGLGVFAASYLVSQVWLVFLQWNTWSLVPLVGPLVQFFTTRGSLTPQNSGEFNLALIGTIGQVIGATAMVVGLVKPIRWLQFSPVTVVPTPGGMAMAGSF